MTIQQSLDELKNIQHKLLDFIDDEENVEEYFQNLIDLLEEQKICKNKYKLKLILYFISNISINHHRKPNFFSKLEKILQYFKNEITEYYSNTEIFNIFKNSKRILLFLNEEKMIKFDKHIIDTITKSQKYIDAQYPEYFHPEIRSFKGEEEIKESKEKTEDEKEDYELFNKRRKNGENHHSICEIIRNDSIADFIKYINKSDYSLTSIVTSSIFETNSFLLENENFTLIQYVAFCGSIQIFKYLMEKEIKLTSQLWLYAIHGQDIQIINLLESKVKIKIKSYRRCLKEAIKCNHNDIANYILNNYLQDEENDLSNYCVNFIKYYNFEFLKSENFNSTYFPILLYCDYYLIIEMQFKEVQIDINEKILDDSDQVEKTLLHIAVERENVDLVGLLLNHNKIDVNIPYNINTCEYNDDNFLKIEETKNALILAVEKGNTEIVKLLLNHEKIDVNCIYRYEKTYKEKLDCFSDASDDSVDYDDEIHFKPNGDSLYVYETKTPFIISVENDNIEITNILLSKEEINVNFQHQFKEIKRTVTFSGLNHLTIKTVENIETDEVKIALHIAAENGNIEIVKLLLSNEKININDICDTHKKISETKYYIQTSDADILGSDNSYTSEEHQKTALFLAVDNEHVEIVKLLLDNEKIDVNIPKIQTPLELSVQKGNADIVECLINNKNTICDLEKLFKINTKVLQILFKHFDMISKDTK